MRNRKSFFPRPIWSLGGPPFDSGENSRPDKKKIFRTFFCKGSPLWLRFGVQIWGINFYLEFSFKNQHINFGVQFWGINLGDQLLVNNHCPIHASLEMWMTSIRKDFKPMRSTHNLRFKNNVDFRNFSPAAPLPGGQGPRPQFGCGVERRARECEWETCFLD